MTEPVSITERQKVALRRRRQRTEAGRLSPYYREGAIPSLDAEAAAREAPAAGSDTTPYPDDGEVSAESEKLIQAIFERYYDSIPKDKRTRAVAKKNPIISDRLARKRSQEDRSL